MSAHSGKKQIESKEFGQNATFEVPGYPVVNNYYDARWPQETKIVKTKEEMDRAIVMHPAWYANPDMLEKWGKLGRSDGRPVRVRALALRKH